MAKRVNRITVIAHYRSEAVHFRKLARSSKGISESMHWDSKAEIATKEAEFWEAYK
jgi:uncharacterized protein YcbK (DUF882 family)